MQTGLNAAKRHASRSFRRRHSCTRILSPPAFPSLSAAIAKRRALSTGLISAATLKQRVFIGTAPTFLFFFFFSPSLARIVCGEMSQWIPVILLSHSQAAGSHGAKLSVGKGFHHRHLFKCATDSAGNPSHEERPEAACCRRDAITPLTEQSHLFFFFHCNYLLHNFIFRWTWDHVHSDGWSSWISAQTEQLGGKTLSQSFTGPWQHLSLVQPAHI